MVKAARTKAGKLMADRLAMLLQSDLSALERHFQENGPDEAQVAATAIKGRVEAVSQITRTLEKLLELRRLEALTLEEASAEDEAETQRLRDELMRRLRAVDARRIEGAGLFAEESA